MKKKTILFLTNGDASNPKTWSNVPYKLTTTFENKGYNVIRCNILTKNNIFTYAYTAFFVLFKPKSTYYYYRSKINRRIVRNRIKKIVQKYDDQVDLYFNITYDFSPSEFTNKPVLLFSDWPSDYHIEKRLKRKPDRFEQKEINYHKNIINDADYKISMYRDVTEYMNGKYKGETKFIGNVINSFVPLKGFEQITNRNYITFIGVKAYKLSCEQLIKAFNELKNPDYELHIIGMSESDFPGINNDKIVFHGYLNKGNDDECKAYYEIIKHTKVIVNTLDKWGGIQSIIEMLYYYRPVITSKYDEFVKTFGKEIEFGYYSQNNSNDILKNINKIINCDDEEYKKMCMKAHEAVKDFTYESYIDRIIEMVEELR